MAAAMEGREDEYGFSWREVSASCLFGWVGGWVGLGRRRRTAFSLCV